MDQPAGFLTRGRGVWKKGANYEKNLYDLKQFSRAWFG